jgi:hypothetical protein
MLETDIGLSFPTLKKLSMSKKRLSTVTTGFEKAGRHTFETNFDSPKRIKSQDKTNPFLLLTKIFERQREFFTDLWSSKQLLRHMTSSVASLKPQLRRFSTLNRTCASSTSSLRADSDDEAAAGGRGQLNPDVPGMVVSWSS